MTCTIPYRDLAAVLAGECRRLGWTNGEITRAYADRFGITVDGASRRLRRAHDAGAVTLDEADRWLTVIDLTLAAVGIDDGADVSTFTTQAWCPACRAMALPDAQGGCVWCGTQTGGGSPPPRPAPSPPRSLRKGDPGYGPECPRCGGPKMRSNLMCVACRRAAGGRGPDRAPRNRKPTAVSQETLDEARRLYASGLSMRQVAESILDRTTYKSVRSATSALFGIFRHRGWPTRPQGEVTRARNWKHGMKRRGVPETPGYRRALKDQRGELLRPKCAAVRTQYPRKGQPCQRPSMVGSRFCVSHDPARAADRDRNLADARARASTTTDIDERRAA